MDIEQVRAAMARRGLGVRATARRIHYDHAMLSRVLRGQQRPSAALEAALTDLLDLEDDDARLNYVAAHPMRLDKAAVEALSGLLAAQRRADDVIGPTPLIAGAEAHRSVLLPMLRDARGPHRDTLATVVAEHVQFLGYLYTAVRDDERGAKLLMESIKLADDAGIGQLACQGHNFMAHIHRRHGRYGVAAQHFQAGAAAPGAHPAQRVRDLARAAQAFGQAGHRQDALRLLGQAEDDAGKLGDVPAPSCAYWLDEPFLVVNLGLANHAVGRVGHAVGLLQDGLARFALGGAYVREARAVLDGRASSSTRAWPLTAREARAVLDGRAVP